MTDSRIPAIITRSFRDIPMVDKGDYHYFVHPLSDGIRSIEPEMLRVCADMAIDAMESINRPDLLLTAEAMGIPLTTVVSERTGIDFSIARKRRYGLKDEIEVTQSTGYSSNHLFMNLPQGVGSVLILDDVLSTGGTLRAMVNGLKRCSLTIEGAIVLFNKMGSERNELSKELKIPIITIFDVDVDRDGCRICISSN